jgi:glycosyltransferase involved in cell wall biosynthesis
VRVVIDYRPALRDRSGAGEYTHQLTKALLAQHAGRRNGDLALTLFSSSWRDRLTDTTELHGATTVDRRLPVRLLNLAWHRFEWPPVELLAGAEFDVTHSQHPLLMPSRHAAQIVTIHDLYFLAHPHRTSAEIRRDYPSLVRDHARRAAAILVPSHFTGGEVERQLGVDATRVTICAPGAPPWPPREHLPGNGYILFLGTLEPRKNVSGLLDAYERLILEEGRSDGDDRPAPGAVPELLLAGKATEEAQPWLARLTRPPLAGRVRHIGYVDPSRRQELYAGARLLVMPSFEEGFGLPVLEAMTVGVPVVAAARGALPEVLGDAGPLVNPDDPVEIAAALRRMLDDEGYAGACAAKGVIRSRAFDWGRTANRVYDVYRSVMADAPAARRSTRGSTN